MKKWSATALAICCWFWNPSFVDSYSVYWEGENIQRKIKQHENPFKIFYEGSTCENRLACWNQQLSASSLQSLSDKNGNFPRHIDWMMIIYSVLGTSSPSGGGGRAFLHSRLINVIMNNQVDLYSSHSNIYRTKLSQLDSILNSHSHGALTMEREM